MTLDCIHFIQPCQVCRRYLSQLKTRFSVTEKLPWFGTIVLIVYWNKLPRDALRLQIFFQKWLMLLQTLLIQKTAASFVTCAGGITIFVLSSWRALRTPPMTIVVLGMLVDESYQNGMFQNVTFLGCHLEQRMAYVADNLEIDEMMSYYRRCRIEYPLTISSKNCRSCGQ